MSLTLNMCMLLINIAKYRPRSLDGLHYHADLSLRLKSLVSIHRVGRFARLTSVHARLLRETFPICSSMALREVAKRRV